MRRRLLAPALAALPLACEPSAPLRPASPAPSAVAVNVDPPPASDAGVVRATPDAGAPIPAPYAVVARGAGNVGLHPVGRDRLVIAAETTDGAIALALVGADGIRELPNEGLPKLGIATSPTKDPLFSRPHPKHVGGGPAAPQADGQWYAGQRELGTVVGYWPDDLFLTVHRWAWEPLVWRVTEIHRLHGSKWTKVSASTSLGVVWELAREWSVGVLAVEENRLADRPEVQRSRTWRAFGTPVAPPPRPPSYDAIVRKVSDRGDVFELAADERAGAVLRWRPSAGKGVELRVPELSTTLDARENIELRVFGNAVEIHGAKEIDEESPVPWSVTVEVKPGALRLVSSARTAAGLRTAATEAARFAGGGLLSHPRAFVVGGGDVYVVGSTSADEWTVVGTRAPAHPWIAAGRPVAGPSTTQ